MRLSLSVAPRLGPVLRRKAAVVVGLVLLSAWSEIAHAEPLGYKDIGAYLSYDFGACVLLAADGTIHCWGDNARGQLGNGTRISSPTPVLATPGPAGFRMRVTALVSGASHNHAMVENGMVYSWGYDNQGQLGEHTTIERIAPSYIHVP